MPAWFLDIVISTCSHMRLVATADYSSYDGYIPENKKLKYTEKAGVVVSWLLLETIAETY